MNYDFEYTQNSKTKAADGAFTLPIEEKQTSDCILKVVDLSQLFSKYETYLKKPHTRDFHVIYWAERVKGKIELNGKLFELHDNSLIFLNEFQTEEFIDTEYISGKIFVFSEHLFYQIKAEALALIYADFFLKSNIMIIKGNALIQEIERLTGNLIDIQQRVCPAVIKFVHMQALITELLCTIYTSDDFKEIRKTIKDLDHKIYRYFTLFLSVVEQHYKEGLTVQQYADMLGVSVRSLGNYVKECTTNCTPQQIITNRIIIETKRLLLTTNKSWKEIASIVNIDASNLTKLFKKTTGITPLKFKEQGYR